MTSPALDDVAIEISNIWKIFGQHPERALEVARQGTLSKQALLEQHDAVVGLADVSLQICRGEIFCVMGLPGSGKSTLVRHFNRL
jgi:glycine betaine/proline transport system ATP-binding protein